MYFTKSSVCADVGFNISLRFIIIRICALLHVYEEVFLQIVLNDLERTRLSRRRIIWLPPPPPLSRHEIDQRLTGRRRKRQLADRKEGVVGGAKSYDYEIH